jgi:multiple antibiotic resistance protein
VDSILQAALPLFVLLNPFMLWVYLEDMLQGLKRELVGGAPQHVAGSIAMPFMIGPGTVSASVFAGEHAGAWAATAAIVLAVAVTIAIVLLIRELHNRVGKKYAAFVDRYTDLVGRISALVIGTIAVDMILRGIDLWRAQS